MPDHNPSPALVDDNHTAASEPLPEPPLTRRGNVNPGPLPTARKPLNRTLIIAAASFVIGAMVGVAGAAITTSMVNNANAQAAAKAVADRPHPLKDAFKSCGLNPSEDAKLGDNDTSLSLHSQGTEDRTGLSMTTINCVLSAIKTPDYVRAEMDKTRALDGTQRESWDSLSASWSYHPNTGFNVGLTEKR